MSLICLYTRLEVRSHFLCYADRCCVYSQNNLANSPLTEEAKARRINGISKMYTLNTVSKMCKKTQSAVVYWQQSQYV
jgi:hypothetical protein